MSSLKADFAELLERIKEGRKFDHASFEPIYYLVFSPNQIIEVKRQIPAWTAKLKNDGWNVNVFSIASEIKKILEAAPLRAIWLREDSKAPLQWEKTNNALANTISNGSLQGKLECMLESLDNDSRNILLITDIEALHPYMRIGTIESQLQGSLIYQLCFYPGLEQVKRD